MATIGAVKEALKEAAAAISVSPSAKKPLSDSQYKAGFDVFKCGSGWKTYEDFIVPQLSAMVSKLLGARARISALEIGPGPKSVLGWLPEKQRRRIGRYTAFEANPSTASELEQWLSGTFKPGTEAPLPCLDYPPHVLQLPFVANANLGHHSEKYDLILLCHSMYGMTPKRDFIAAVLDMLVHEPLEGAVVVFHREGIRFDGLVCHRIASFPSGAISVPNDDTALDSFSRFVAGFSVEDGSLDERVRVKWRKVCRALGDADSSQQDPRHLVFSNPEVMVTFTRHATALPKLLSDLPLTVEPRKLKNRGACFSHAAAVVRPTSTQQVQSCVRWAIQHKVGLTVIGGGHGGHCVVPNVVAVDMSSFNDVGVVSSSTVGPLVIAEAGAMTRTIVEKAMTAGLAVPLGSRPSVGAGLWLQGGLGHLARIHGLTCDAIVGVVFVSLKAGEIFYVGHVPIQHRPVGGRRADNENDILWAMKGAGTNFGIVIRVVFKALKAPVFSARNGLTSVDRAVEAKDSISAFSTLAGDLSRRLSADAYLYWDAGRLHHGLSIYQVEEDSLDQGAQTAGQLNTILGRPSDCVVVDGIGLFDTELYVSHMHGGHGGGKTCSFKRCLFLKDIGSSQIAEALVTSMESCPTPLCYLHLLHGGGAVGDVAPEATAFGCRNWDFACVVTGVWRRDQDGTALARAAQDWVYHVVGQLLPLSVGAYGADLGPDPRDTALAAMAFGPNRPRLSRLKKHLDPFHLLAYACPLPMEPLEPKLIILITGDHGAGKDFCANIWVSVLEAAVGSAGSVRSVSISDATKREYAAATNADLSRLLRDRTYKEEHRPALTAFYQAQLPQRPRLPEEHFLNVIYGAGDAEVLFITGMSDEAPVATFSHLVPDSRVVEVCVQADATVRRVRRGVNITVHGGGNSGLTTRWIHAPDFVFVNDATGDAEVRAFAASRLVPLVHKDFKHLADLVRTTPDFPRQGIDFRHVLGITQQPGGLSLCASLLARTFAGDWTNVGAIVSCEAGGFLFGSSLASHVHRPLVLVRKTGKLPPPVVSTAKSPSHISSSPSLGSSGEEILEMERDAIPKDTAVVVVDDVLATGRTLCAVLRLLTAAGVDAAKVLVMVVAEFPTHRGRKLLLQGGFEKVTVQSLMVFGGM